MASVWQKTLFYLGLVDEDEAQPYESPARSYAESARTDPYGYPAQDPAPDPERVEATEAGSNWTGEKLVRPPRLIPRRTGSVISAA